MLLTSPENNPNISHQTGHIHDSGNREDTSQYQTAEIFIDPYLHIEESSRKRFLEELDLHAVYEARFSGTKDDPEIFSTEEHGSVRFEVVRINNACKPVVKFRTPFRNQYWNEQEWVLHGATGLTYIEPVKIWKSGDGLLLYPLDELASKHRYRLFLFPDEIHRIGISELIAEDNERSLNKLMVAFNALRSLVKERKIHPLT